MKTLRILLLAFIVLNIVSCEKEEPTSFESVDLKYNEFLNPIPKPKKIFTLKCNTSLKFKLRTKEDQLGKFASTEMVEFRGKIWSVGGFLNNQSYPYQTNGVWSSNDGIHWTSEVFNAFDSRVSHTLTVFDNKLWVIGGVNNSGHQLSDIWYSSDGRNWTLATNTPAFGGITGHSTIVFKDHLVVFKHHDIWASPDGVRWKRVAKDIFPSRNRSEFILYNDIMYIIGGENWSGTGTFYNEIWQSTDGKNWTQVAPSGPIFSSRSRLTATIYQDKVWVIGGSQASGYDSDQIWVSKNMKEWCKYGGSTPFTNISSHSSLVLGDSIWVFGGFASYGMAGAIWSFKTY